MWPLLVSDLYDLGYASYCCYCKNGESPREELWNFGYALLHADAAEFETMINIRPNMTIELFTVGCMLGFFCGNIRSFLCEEDRLIMIEKLEMLFSKTNLITKIMEAYEQPGPLIWYFADRFDPMDLNEITKLCCLFMMRGINVYPRDLEAVYLTYGYCELYEIMLHMDIVNDFKEHLSLMNLLMFDMTMEIDVCLEKRYEFLLEADIDDMVKYFALPKFKKDCLKLACGPQTERVANLPEIPSLVELGRNAARKFIKKEFNVKTSRQFYTVLNSLNIPKCCKDVIALKRPLYDV